MDIVLTIPKPRYEKNNRMLREHLDHEHFKESSKGGL